MDIELPEYREHKDHQAIIDSAYHAAKSILGLDLYPAHKRELLDICIWKITEVDGKYKTRYRSIGALGESTQGNLQHEHVFEKKKLITDLIDQPENYKTILDTAVACVVTKNEHKLLTAISREDKTLHGWDRYQVANIAVYDLVTKQRVI